MDPYSLQNLSSLRRDKRQINALIATKRMFYIYTSLSQVVVKTISICSYEFGGPWGVIAIMTGFPILMYYLWICLWFYDGKLVYPSSVDDIQPFLWRMWGHVAKVGNLSVQTLLSLLLSSIYRMLVQIYTDGRSTRAISSFSCFSLGLCPVTNRKAFQCLHLATKLSHTTAMPYIRCTLH